MTHEELEAIRLAATNSWGVSPHHVHALFAYINELHGIVHDLRQEPGWELGRQEERREILAVLGQRLDTLRDLGASGDNIHEAACALETVKARGPVAPHLAPDDLRRENEALRPALGAIVSAYRSEDALTRWSRVTAAIRAAAPLLDEEEPGHDA